MMRNEARRPAQFDTGPVGIPICMYTINDIPTSGQKTEASLILWRNKSPEQKQGIRSLLMVTDRIHGGGEYVGYMLRALRDQGAKAEAELGRILHPPPLNYKATLFIPEPGLG